MPAGKKHSHDLFYRVWLCPFARKQKNTAAWHPYTDVGAAVFIVMCGVG